MSTLDEQPADFGRIGGSAAASVSGLSRLDSVARRLLPEVQVDVVLEAA